MKSSPENSTAKKEMFQNAGILFAITLIAGILLGFVSRLTADPIAAQQELKIQNACREVFADAAVFSEWSVSDKAAYSAFCAGLETEYGVKCGTVYEAQGQDGELLGYVIGITSTQGYGGSIELMEGYRLDGTLNGISILSISETPGLGMQAGEVLVPQFAGKNVEQFVYTKTGAATEEEIDAISGATITTKAVTGAVNAGLQLLSYLTGGDGE